jgi:hypothetical protein
MTRKGTIKDPPDPTLTPADGERIGGGDATPAGHATDRAIAIAKAAWERIEGLSLNHFIDGWIGEPVTARDRVTTEPLIEEICNVLRGVRELNPPEDA